VSIIWTRSRLAGGRLPHSAHAAGHALPGRATSRRPDACLWHGLPPRRL